jgi:hypothetical protein
LNLLGRFLAAFSEGLTVPVVYPSIGPEARGCMP